MSRRLGEFWGGLFYQSGRNTTRQTIAKLLVIYVLYVLGMDALA